MDKIYEFKVLSIVDDRGSCDIEKLTTELNTYGLAGWHVVGAYSNTLGKNALSIGGFGLNNSVEENIVILQREKEATNKDLKKREELQKAEDEINELSSFTCDKCGTKISATDKKCPACKTINPYFGLLT